MGNTGRVCQNFKARLPTRGLPQNLKVLDGNKRKVLAFSLVRFTRDGIRQAFEGVEDILYMELGSSLDGVDEQVVLRVARQTV